MDTKKLRQKILDLAIRGKLVPQDPNDEPVAVLLERIRAEKQQLIKEGKIKAPKGSKACDTSHYENEIPKGWCITSLGEVFTLQAGKNISAADIHEESDMFPYPCYGGNGIRGYVKSYNRSGHYPLIGRQGALCGNINEVSGNFYATEHCVVVSSFSDVDVNWVVFLLKALNLNQYATATAQPGLSVATINDVRFYLPPVKEQKRIAAALSMYSNLIDSIDKEAVSLFDAINTTKSKILELAISGNLVPQDPSDEPAIQLLKRINPNFKPCDNSHYENLPNGWVYAMGKDIITLLSGRDLPPSKFNAEQRGIPYLIGASNININKIHITRWTDYPEVISSQNDVLISCKGTVGEIVINNIGEIHIARQFMALRTAVIIPEYLNLLMQSKVSLLKESAKGVIPGISREDILNLKIAIPPIAEQLRIVESVGTLMGLVNKILY